MHQYVERASGAAVTEHLFGDQIVRLLYSRVRERAPALFHLLTSARVSGLLAWMQFDVPFSAALLGNRRFLARCGIDFAECVDPPAWFTTPRRIFERRIRYWECRPMPADPAWVVSPADARVALGSLDPDAPLFLKDKLFTFEELLGADRLRWLAAFRGGDFAVLRLTPDRYHWNHAPVSGRVVDHYEIAGALHACNPSAAIEIATPCSKNRRVVTVIDTDVTNGTGIGFVAMIEVVALLVGDVVQGYSHERYEAPVAVEPGLFVERGQPKSLYRPGSSTDVLLFQPGRVEFAADLVANARRRDVASRYSKAFPRPVVETDVRVRAPLARRRQEDAR